MASRFELAALLALSALLLTACTANPTSQAPQATQPASIAAMTTDEAAAAYLAAVCPSNRASTANDAAFRANNLDEILTTAKSWQAADQKAAEALDKPPKPWPPEVSDDVGTVRDYVLDQLVSLDTLTRKSTLSEARAVPFPKTVAASQKVRLRLGLNADTSVGC